MGPQDGADRWAPAWHLRGTAHRCSRAGRPPSLATTLVPVARGPCGHARAEAGYHPSRALQHLIRARNARCTAPGYARPAARCDLDHTRPRDQGGPSCECNLAPRCKR